MTTLDEYIEKLGLGYSAYFVPQSKSRNKDEKAPCLNWIVTISKSTHSSQQLTTDYMQGIAHAPGYGNSFTQGGHKDVYFKLVAEEGKTLKRLPTMGNGKIDWFEAHHYSDYTYKVGVMVKLPEPKLKDVLYNLVMDASVLDYDSFESWALGFGYNIDQREAEKTYNACMKVALKLKSLIGSVALDGLRDLFTDY